MEGAVREQRILAPGAGTWAQDGPLVNHMVLNLVDIQAQFARLQQEMKKYYFGPESIVQEICITLLARGHILLEGVPGVAKTTLARYYAALLGLSAKRIQFTPDLLPSDITGMRIPGPDFQSQKFIPGPLFTQVLLADEINRAPAKTQAALLEALEENRVTVDGTTYALYEPFFVLATQNPQESAGTFLLPEATIDRFLIRIRLGYPDREQELSMMHAHHVIPPLPAPLFSATQLVETQALVERVQVSEPLMRYALSLVRATRRHPQLELGASPRAGLALLRASKARAVLQGRDFATPEDVRALAIPVLGHRLRLSYEAENRGVTPESIVHRLIQDLDLI